MPRLVVLGSANRDFTVVVEHHPQPGETVLGSDLVSGTGGKGANQAVAAARAGVRPLFVGAVGDDATGQSIVDDLAASGVDVTHLARVRQPTGVALITVERAGENTIVVAAGANHALEPEAIATLVAGLCEPGAVLLAQLEIPVDTVDAAAHLADRAGARFVLNLSPSTTVPSRMLALADPVILNETEASELAGSRIDSPADAEVVARRLLATSRSVVITLGGSGVIVAETTGTRHLPAHRVKVVDTTGAGDAFAGALAAALASARPLVEAVESGIAAGAEAVQYVGAQSPRG